MSTVLSVVYYSQKDKATAGYSINDCGPACLAMMARTMGRNVTADQIYKDAGITAKGPLAVNTIKAAGNLYGLNLQRHDHSSGFGLTKLQTFLDQGRPALVLVDYFPVMRAGLHESRINGGHFVVAVGYDDNYIHVHDPYWDGEGGAYRTWPIPVWNEAWYQYGTQYQKISLVPANPIAQPKHPAYPIPPEVLRRLRAKALFVGQPVPVPQNDSDYANALAWLGDWGVETVLYTIQPGDTLAEVSEQFYGSSAYYTVVAAFNGIANADQIEVGQQLLIPIPPGVTVSTSTTTEPVTQPPSYSFTHQQLINAFHKAFQARADKDKWWDYVTAAGLAYIANNRSDRYTGPDLKTVPNLPDDVRAAVLKDLGIV